MNPEAFLRFASDFNLSVDHDRYRMLCSREGAGFRVAVIGLVSRGKSTLVNRIVGLELCPVDARAESVANVYISSGKPGARAVSLDGPEVSIKSDAAGFRARLPRRIAPTIKEAEFRGKTRLPEGITLVDTPGLNDAGIASKNLGELDRYWLDTGATAAVLVLSYPPGFAQSDRQLLESAKRVFGSALVVVIKATDSGVDRDELEQVAEAVAANTGISPLVLGDKVPTGKWGTGDLANLENRLSVLATQATTLIGNNKEELDDIHRLAAFTVAKAPMTALTTLEQFSLNYPGLPAEVIRAATQRRQELIDVREHELRVQKEAEQLRRVQLLDREAEKLAGLLASTAHSSSSRSTGNVLNELLQMAREGSAAARNALERHLPRKPERRNELGVTLTSFISGADINQLLPVIGRLELAQKEAIALVTRTASGTDLDAITTAAIAYCKLPSTRAPSVGELSSKAKDPELARSLRSEYRTRVLDDIRHAISQCRDLVACRVLIGQLKDAADVLRPNGLGAPETDAGRTWFTDSLATMTKGGRERVLWVLGEVERKEMAAAKQMTVARARSVTAEANGVAQWAAAPDHHVSLRFVRIFTPNGELERWAAACETARVEAAQRSTSRAEMWGGVWVFSFLGWVIAIATLASNPGLAFGIWVVSFIMWLPSRSLRNRPTPWELLFRTPPLASVTTGGEPLGQWPPPPAGTTAPAPVAPPVPANSGRRARRLSAKGVGLLAVLIAVSLAGGVVLLKRNAEPAKDSTPSQIEATVGTISPLPISPTQSRPATGTGSPTPPNTPSGDLLRHPYFFGLASHSLDGTALMTESSTPGSPAWIFARQLALEGWTAPRWEEWQTTLGPTEFGQTFCSSSRCWIIDNIEYDDLGKVFTFTVNAQQLSERVALWDVGPGECRVLTGSECFSPSAATIQLTSLFTGGSTTATVFVDAGDELTAPISFLQAMVFTKDGRLLEFVNWRASNVEPGQSRSWWFEFDGVPPGDINSIVITATWQGGTAEWTLHPNSAGN